MSVGKRERLLFVVAALCVGAFVGDRFVVTPLWDLWRARSARVVELRQSLAKGEELLRREQSLRERWDDMKRRSLSADVSRAEDATLTAVSRWSRESGLSVTSLKPRWVDNADDGYLELEFLASARGDIKSLARFLYELERDKLPARLAEVEIATRDDKGADLTLTTRFSGVVLTEADR